MRLDPDPKIGDATNSQNFKFNLYKLFQRVHQQLNQLTEGRITAVQNAGTAAPTTGVYMQGDFVRNIAPTAVPGGGSGNHHITMGWVCTESGEPGTWHAVVVRTTE